MLLDTATWLANSACIDKRQRFFLHMFMCSAAIPLGSPACMASDSQHQPYYPVLYLHQLAGSKIVPALATFGETQVC